MDPNAASCSEVKQQYASVRHSLTLFEERVAADHWDNDGLARASFECLLGLMDMFAGWLLADEEISHRGQALMRWTRYPAGAEAEETRGKIVGDEQVQHNEQQVRDEADVPVTVRQARPGTEEAQAGHVAAECAADQPYVSDEPVADTSPVDVTFTLPAEVQADSVALCGEFNHWSAGDIQLERGSDGTWQATVSLQSGRSYRYRYLLDGECWENAWHAERYVPNPYGSVDSIIIVEPSPS